MMNAVVKPYHEMCLNSSELIVPRDTYQRALHPARVARIAKEFDERVANEPKISFRDGHYYVMDGQNTIAARKFLNGGEDLQIRCKVYFGKVVFHSFRHSSITYKLKLNGGDIKAVQGDSGHAQASMVTEQYAHILDDDRRLNAQRFDDFFYRHQGAEPEMPHQTAQPIPENSAVDADAAAALTKLLANPSMAELIKNLAKNL